MQEVIMMEEVEKSKTSRVAPYKKEIVAKIVDNIRKYNIIGVVNMENLPAKQLQKLRATLRGKVTITMTKRRLISLALENAEQFKPGISKLKAYLAGMPGMIFTNDNPFRLYRLLQKSKSKAFAKANQTAPEDIVITAGPTPFAPGPIIGELAMVGIKAGVEGGKVAIKQDSVVAKKDQPILPKVAEILTRLGIEPMFVGLDLTTVYENGTVYLKDVLSIDEDVFMRRVSLAHSGAFNLAVYISYPSRFTISYLLGRAFTDAKALGISRNLFEKEIMPSLLAKGYMHAFALEQAQQHEI